MAAEVPRAAGAVTQRLDFHDEAVSDLDVLDSPLITMNEGQEEPWNLTNVHTYIHRVP